MEGRGASAQLGLESISGSNSFPSKAEAQRGAGLAGRPPVPVLGVAGSCQASQPSLPLLRPSLDPQVWGGPFGGSLPPGRPLGSSGGPATSLWPALPRFLLSGPGSLVVGGHFWSCLPPG